MTLVYMLTINSPFHQVMNEDGHTSNIRDKILTINVKPGWKSGTRITFPNEGDQGPNNIPGNNQGYLKIQIGIMLIS